jgi:hypothetical protein
MRLVKKRNQFTFFARTAVFALAFTEVFLLGVGSESLPSSDSDDDDDEESDDEESDTKDGQVEKGQHA